MDVKASSKLKFEEKIYRFIFLIWYFEGFIANSSEKSIQNSLII